MGRPAIDLTGQRFGTRTVIARAEMEGVHFAAFWHVICDCGNTSIVRGQYLRGGRHQTCRACAKRQPEVSYSGIHARLLRERGKAAALPCTGCGEPALHWAFQGDGHDSGALAYSQNLNDFAPMCAPCHKAFDTKEMAR